MVISRERRRMYSSDNSPIAEESYHCSILAMGLAQMPLQDETQVLAHLQSMLVVFWHVHPDPVQPLVFVSLVKKLDHGHRAVVVVPQVFAANQQEELRFH